MASVNFENSYNLLIKFQPPYKNNEGNENLVENFGIHKSDFESFASRSYTRDEYYDLTADDFKPYFKSEFWDECGCNDIFPGVDFLVLSYAMSNDAETAIEKLQQVLGVSQTGTFDATTKSAVDNQDDAVKKTKVLSDLLSFLSSVHSEEKFAKIKDYAQFLV